MTASANIPLARPFSVPQLAHRWGCSEGLICKMIRDGRLHCFRPGTLIRISAAEVERFECQQQAMMTRTASSASGEGSPSSGERMESAGESNSRRQIARARKRKPAQSGPSRKVVTGPWGGA